MTKNKVALVSLMLVVALVFTSGCGSKGPKKFAVSGTVSIGGATATEGTIEFRGETGNASVINGGASINSDGTFKIEAEKGLTEGKYTVVCLVVDPDAESDSNIEGLAPTYKTIELPQKIDVGKGSTEFKLEVPNDN